MKNFLRWLTKTLLIAAMASAQADPANPLTGFYYGTASIAQPAGLGTIDLAFYLDVTGTAIQKATSYIDLGKTLLFPAVTPQIGGVDVGPRVSGSLGPTSFSLSSDVFQSTVSGKSTPVSRSIVLNNATVTNGGAAISGNYTETVTGLAKAPISITGTFMLVKPMPVTQASGVDRNADGCLDLGEIRAGGSEPNRVEFGDLSAAMNLYNKPLPALKVGNPPGPNCTGGDGVVQGALIEYYGERQ